MVELSAEGFDEGVREGEGFVELSVFGVVAVQDEELDVLELFWGEDF